MAAEGRPPTSLARRLLALLAYPLLFVAMLVLILLFREQLWAVAPKERNRPDGSLVSRRPS